MDLIVNGTAIHRSSLGAQRYYRGVMQYLAWRGKIEVTPPSPSRFLDRISDFTRRGRRDAILWSPFHRGPLFARNHIVTVLDCINVQYTYQGDWRLPLLRANFGALLANAVRIVAISKATRDAISNCFGVNPSRVSVVAGPTDFSDELVEMQRADACHKQFILMVTNRLPHKNTPRAVRSLAASKAVGLGVILRVVGTLDDDSLRICDAAGLRIEQCSGVEDAKLRQWMRECLFLFSPSLEEGLNLPIGEAITLGGNVLCSDIPVHREFYEGAAYFFDPLDELAMARAIDSALLRPQRWGLPGAVNLRTFRDVARDYCALFEEVSEHASDG